MRELVHETAPGRWPTTGAEPRADPPPWSVPESQGPVSSRFCPIRSPSLVARPQGQALTSPWTAYQVAWPQR